MSGPTWIEIITALSAVATPIIVVIFGWILTRRQSRNELLLKARIDYYQQLAPDLNRLMTYMMFIGSWRDLAPPDVVALKRRLDAAFYVAAPLFSGPVTTAYGGFMRLCFVAFGRWGADALIKSSPLRRRENWRSSQPWDPAWDELFELRDEDPIESEALEALRAAYDSLISALVTDLNINRARVEYTSARAVSSAGGRIRTVDGSNQTTATGAEGARVELRDDSVIIARTGAFSGIGEGGRLEIPLSEISEVHVGSPRQGLRGVFIVVTSREAADGGMERNNINPKAVYFDVPDQPSFEALRAAILNRLPSSE